MVGRRGVSHPSRLSLPDWDRAPEATAEDRVGHALSRHCDVAQAGTLSLSRLLSVVFESLNALDQVVID